MVGVVPENTLLGLAVTDGAPLMLGLEDAVERLPIVGFDGFNVDETALPLLETPVPVRIG